MTAGVSHHLIVTVSLLRLTRKENDYNGLEKRFRGLEAELAALRAQTTDAESRRKFADEELSVSKQLPFDTFDKLCLSKIVNINN